MIARLLPIRDEKWSLTMDRTHWKLGRLNSNLLLLGMADQGIAFPLRWTLRPKAGNCNTAPPHRTDGALSRAVSGREGCRAACRP